MAKCSNCKLENSDEEVFCRRCRSNLHSDSPYFLNFEDFGYPRDIDNMELMMEVEPITSLVNSAVDFFQKSGRARLLKDAVLIREENQPLFYKLSLDCAEKLCLSFLPEIYILPSRELNAFTIGGRVKPIVVINSALLKMMNNEELAAVLGHEMGHIKGDHQKLHTMAYLLANGITFFSRLSILAFPLQLGLKSWLRYSELTADRASLLIAKDLELIVKVQRKISGGKQLQHGIMGSEGWREFVELWRSHPFTENRIKESKEFYSSKSYKRLLLKMISAKVMRCPHCNFNISAETVFCPRCRKALR